MHVIARDFSLQLGPHCSSRPCAGQVAIQDYQNIDLHKSKLLLFIFKSLLQSQSRGTVVPYSSKKFRPLVLDLAITHALPCAGQSEPCAQFVYLSLRAAPNIMVRGIFVLFSE